MGNGLTWCIFGRTIADSPLTRLISSICNSASIARMHFPAAREGTLRRRHFEWKRGAQLRSMQEERRVRSARSKSEQIPTSLVKTLENRPEAQISVGTARSCGSSFVLFLSPSSPLWLTIFYITTTQPGLGTDSPAKVLCDRKTCTKWKTTNLSRVFSSSRRSAATAQILYGEQSVFVQRFTFKCTFKLSTLHFL